MELVFLGVYIGLLCLAYFVGWKRGAWQSSAVLNDMLRRGLIKRDEETGGIVYSSGLNEFHHTLNNRLTTIEELTRALYKKQIGVSLDQQEIKELWTKSLPPRTARTS